MKTSAGRTCSCGLPLRLPEDVIEVDTPDSNQGIDGDAPDPPKRAVRKKYVRAPGEKPNLSTKMQYLYNELLKSSKRNPNSQHYDPFSLALADDDVEELDTSGQPFVTKSVIL